MLAWLELLPCCSIALEAVAIPGKDLLFRKLRGSRRSQVILINLVKHRAVADLKQSCSGFTVPPGSFKCCRNCVSFSFALDILDEALEGLGRRARSVGFIARSCAQ